MPRRNPPTPLRLHQGPLPSRTQPKHTLPSVPRPTFVPLAPAGPGPLPRTRIQEAVPVVHYDALRLSYNQLPILAKPSRLTSGSSQSHSRQSSWDSDGATSPTGSVYTNGSVSRRSSVDSLASDSNWQEEEKNHMPVRQRGPWDHSASIQVHVDVESVLPLPRPVAVNTSVQ
ncbi:hypothetical protein BDY19DRAFT_446811 [Irpex rosettiformis]|uniref:Uncharacterized protein n=1 Tax=Irpex rosettiformis TaxID=378272 RepID=A0ACB8TU04_9APHY|nr:hypothetical protein BDY19DRAFT_446811 [Irpex rosettiformis]